MQEYYECFAISLRWGLTLVSFGWNINGNENSLGAVWHAKRPRSLCNIAKLSGAQVLMLNWLYELLNIPPLSSSQAFSFKADENKTGD